MSKLRETDEFIDLNLSLDGLETQGIDTDTDIDSDELELSLDFDLDGLDLLLDLPLDVDVPTLTKVSEDGLEILENIQKNNDAYEKTTIHQKGSLDFFRKDIVKTVFEMCKKTPNNREVCKKKPKEIKSCIIEFIDSQIHYIKMGVRNDSMLSSILMFEDIEFLDDMHIKQLDEFVKDNVNKLACRLEEIERETIVDSSGNFLKLDLETLSDYGFDFVKSIKFTGELDRMFVCCPVCGSEYEHKIIESTKPIGDVLKCEAKLKHNPLICDKCNTVSVLPEVSFNICVQHIVEQIREADENLMDKEVAVVDMNMLTNIPEAEICYAEIKPKISEDDITVFVNTQKVFTQFYNKRFFGSYLSHAKRCQEKKKLFDLNALAQLNIFTGDNAESLVIGAIYNSGYFTILKDCYERKSTLLYKYLQASRAFNFVNLVINADKEESGFKKAELELSFGAKALTDNLKGMGMSIKGVDVITADNLKDVCVKLLPTIKKYISECSNRLDKIASDVDSAVDFISNNAISLFRFVEVKEGNSLEFYKLFNSVQQGADLIEKVYPVLCRHIWDRCIVNNYIKKFSNASRLKNKVTDSELNVKKSCTKVLEPYKGVSVNSDPVALNIYGHLISTLPKEYIGLINAIETRNIYSFYYNVISLRGIQPPKDGLPRSIYDIIVNTVVPKEIASVMADTENLLDEEEFRTKMLMAVKSGDLYLQAALNGHKLNLCEHKELVCKLYMCKYVDSYITSKDLADTANLFVTTCIQIVDLIYNQDTTCGFVEYMRIFTGEDAPLVTSKVHPILVDSLIGYDIIGKMLRGEDSFSVRLADRADSVSSDLGEVEPLKIIYSELPESFKFRREFVCSMLSVVADFSKENELILHLTDDEDRELMNLYLSCLAEDKFKNSVFSELNLDRSMFDVYRKDFNDFCSLIGSKLSPRNKSEFDMLVSRI